MIIVIKTRNQNAFRNIGKATNLGDFPTSEKYIDSPSQKFLLMQIISIGDN
jgi:hypothetical protein